MSGNGHTDEETDASVDRLADERGAVRRRSVLDLSHVRSAEELAAITRIERVAVVIVPESLAAAYAAIPAEKVAQTVHVPDGANVRVHTGPLIVGGDGLGGPDDVLVVVGLLLVTSPVTGPVPRQITVVGMTLAPRGSEADLGPALAGGAGVVSYYRYVDGQDVTVHTGQTRLSAATLANTGGKPQDLLIVAGQVVVTGPVAEVGYAQVLVAGQFVAPEASREVLEPKTVVHGQSAWYRGEEVRFVVEDTRLGPDFFRLLERPVSLVVVGDVTIAPGVTEDAVRAKVTDIVLVGDITAPAELVGLLQVLSPDAVGSVRSHDEPRG